MKRRWITRQLLQNASWVVFWMVSGCAWIPKGDPPAAYIEPPELKETLAEVTSRLHNWPEDHWWELFGNPELNQLVETALKDNPGLKRAAARLR